MDVLSVAGKEYVKASVIAKDLGYTADYVGQLCRSHRVHAKLVGRSWYVERDSIHIHKGNRYRTNQAKSKESLKKEVHIQINPTSTYDQKQPKFYLHTAVQPKNISYETDDTDLIPVVGATRATRSKLEVGLADAVPVSVVSKEKSYKMDAPPLPEIKFSGILTVEDLEDATPGGIDPKAHVIHPKDSDSKNGSKNIVISDVPLKIVDEQKPSFSVTRLSQSQVKSEAVSHLSVGESRKEVPHHVAATEVVIEKTSPLLLATAFLVSLVITGALLGLQANLTIEEGIMTTSYLFEVDHLSASAYTAAESAHAIFDLFKFSTNFFIF